MELFFHFSVDYICQVAGCRTVPVELGSRYTDEEWSQKLMTVNDFINQYIVNEVCYSIFLSFPKASVCTGIEYLPSWSLLE